MKVMTAQVVEGKLDVPEGSLQEGAWVTVLVPEAEAGFRLSEIEKSKLQQAMAQGDRGEFMDGWRLLQEIGG